MRVGTSQVTAGWARITRERTAAGFRLKGAFIFFLASLESLAFALPIATGIVGPRSASCLKSNQESTWVRSEEHTRGGCNAKMAGWQLARNRTRQSKAAQGAAADSSRAARSGRSLPETSKNPPPNVDDLDRIKSFEEQIKAGKFSELEPDLIAYLGDHPNSWRAHYMLGYVGLRLRKLGESVNELSRSLELNVHNAEAHKDLGQVLSVIGRYEEAERELSAARSLEPSSAEIRYDLSRILAAQDNFPQARQELETAIRLNPNYMEAYNALGFALDALGDDAGALASYQRAIQISEKEGLRFDAPYVNLSSFYGHRGALEVSLAYARKALDQNPKSDSAYYQMGKAYRTLGDWQHAADALEHAIDLRPSSSQYHYILGSVYRKLGRIKESQEQMEIFAELEKKTADLEVKRGASRRAMSLPHPKISEQPPSP